MSSYYEYDCSYNQKEILDYLENDLEYSQPVGCMVVLIQSLLKLNEKIPDIGNRLYIYPDMGNSYPKRLYWNLSKKHKNKGLSLSFIKDITGNDEKTIINNNISYIYNHFNIPMNKIYGKNYI